MSKLPSLASAILYREVQLRNLERKKTNVPGCWTDEWHH